MNGRRSILALTVILALGLVLTPSTSRADDDPSTLAAVLCFLLFDFVDSTVLVVDADRTRRMSRAPEPGVGFDPATITVLPSELSPVLDRFDRSYANFHAVSALGPRTMQILNVPKSIDTTPSTVSILDATRMLFGSFTEEEWRAAGGDGLTLDALTGTQRQIYADIVCRPILVAPSNIALPDLSLIDTMDKASMDAFDKRYTAAEVTIPADDLRSATKLHVYFTADFDLHNDHGQSTPRFNDMRDASPPGIDYRLSIRDQPLPGPGPLDDTRQVVPNTLKPSDLNWDDKRLAVDAEFPHATDVANIVRIAAEATGLQMHVSPHYASRKVMLLGPPRAKIVDILQALDFALSGSWRKVGPAYVLTNDVLGLGTRRYWIHALVDPHNGAAEDQVSQESSNFNALPLYKDVGFLTGDRLSIPPAVLQKLEEGKVDDIDTGDLPPNTVLALKQEASLLVDDEYRVGRGTYSTKMPQEEARTMLAGIGLSTKVKTRLILHLAIDTQSYGRIELDPGTNLIFYRYKPALAATVDAGLDVHRLNGHPLSVAALPNSADEARRLVDQLAGAGIHQLYCPAFYGGESYFPSKTMPPLKSNHADVLAAAIDEGHKRNVDVSAVVQLMRWKNGVDRVGDRPIEKLAEEDLTIGGETARQALQHVNPTPSIEESLADADALNGVWMSPADPHIVPILTKLIAEVAAIPGLKSIALVDASAPGYNHDIGEYSRRIELGYTPEMRLGFLRQTGDDPIDFGISGTVKLGTAFSAAHLTRLYIDDFEGHGPNTNDEKRLWADYRKSVNDTLLREVADAARNASPSTPLLVIDGSNVHHLDDRLSVKPGPAAATVVKFDQLSTPDKTTTDPTPVVIDCLTGAVDTSMVDRLVQAIGNDRKR